MNQLLIALSLFLIPQRVTGEEVVITNVPVVEEVAQAAYAPHPELQQQLTIDSTSEIEKRVREYFRDIPEMIAVARCESGFRQFDEYGDVLVGIVNHDDKGVLQINEQYHLSTARKMNIDINTLQGNLAYGRILYKAHGLKDWSASKKCWSSKL